MSTSTSDWPLDLDEYARYGRQMIMSDWGLDGQLKIKNARVAVIGAGGLGCPVLQYLVGAGIGSVSIFDHDTVSVSNLHRQVLHTTERVGMNKALSACIDLKALNPHPELVPHTEPVLPSTALEQLAGHDLVLDCTDRPATRYLIADACVALDTPLVSGAAVSGAGQWAVYGGRYAGPEGPVQRACYRCLWPSAPVASQNCEDSGVWGVVTGMVGCAMAAEALRVLIDNPGAPLLNLLHLGGAPLVRTVKMRPRQKGCVACGDEARDVLAETDYEVFCGIEPALGGGDRIGAEELKGKLDEAVVVDTRPEVEYAICALPNTTNIPLATILSTPTAVPTAQELILLCRRGNDSQIAAAALRTARPDASIADVRGGLQAWSKTVDPTFPIY